MSFLIFCGLSLWLQRNTWQNHFWPDSIRSIQRLLPAPENKHTLWRWNRHFVFPLVTVGREPRVATTAALSCRRRRSSVFSRNVRWIFSLIKLDVVVWDHRSLHDAKSWCRSFFRPPSSERAVWSNNGEALFVFEARNWADRIWLSRAELN